MKEAWCEIFIFTKAFSNFQEDEKSESQKRAEEEEFHIENNMAKEHEKYSNEFQTNKQGITVTGTFTHQSRDRINYYSGFSWGSRGTG